MCHIFFRPFVLLFKHYVRLKHALKKHVLNTSSCLIIKIVQPQCDKYVPDYLQWMTTFSFSIWWLWPICFLNQQLWLSNGNSRLPRTPPISGHRSPKKRLRLRQLCFQVLSRMNHPAYHLCFVLTNWVPSPFFPIKSNYQEISLRPIKSY